MKKIGKGRVSSFVMGFVVALILVISSTMVMAAGGLVSIDVYFDRINISVNGVAVDQSNILYDGTTYAPLRAVAEMLGYEVTWIPETNTADIRLPGDEALSQAWVLQGVEKTVTGASGSGFYTSTYVTNGEKDIDVTVTADKLSYAASHTWSDLPDSVKVGEKVDVTLESDVTNNVNSMYSISSELWAFYGTSTRSNSDGSESVNKIGYLTSEVEGTLGETHCKASSINGTLSGTSPLTVSVVAPEHNSSDSFYVVVEHFGGAGGALRTFYVYEYVWVE